MARVEFHELDKPLMHYVYILASRPRGALYIGSTNELGRRMLEHKEGVGSRHTARYGITKLVWLERHDMAEEAVFHAVIRIAFVEDCVVEELQRFGRQRMLW